MSRPRSRRIWTFLRKLIVGFAWIAVGLLTVLVGISIPSHFRSISPKVLAAAGTEGETIFSLAQNALEEGKPAITEQLLPLLSSSTDITKLETELASLYSEFPYLRWTGGPAAFYEPFVKDNDLNPERTALMPVLLPDPHRAWLRAYLDQSPSRRVKAILETGELTDYQLFVPVFSSAGRPLEATLILIGLCEQSQILSSDFTAELNLLVDSALDGNAQSLQKLEAYYAAFLTLANRLNFYGLTTLLGNLETGEDLLTISSEVQKDDRRLSQFMAGSLLVEDSSTLIRYLKSLKEKGWEGLETALPMGEAAVETLIRFDKPLYQSPFAWQKLPAPLKWDIPALNQFAERTPNLALVSKAILLGIAGSLLLSGLFTLAPSYSDRGSARIHHLMQADKIVGGLVVMILLWVLFEPSLLHFAENEEGSLQLNLAQVLPSNSETESQSSESMIDQVTILILLFFFVVQMMVFIFGLIRINEIKRQSVSSDIKIKLLDNEDYLFDLGLYIGLGGTVTSLILIVLNFVDASLMAAYASTLFGIIFVAVLKIGFLRPYRRKVILSTERSS